MSPEVRGFRLALLKVLLPDNEPLVGDLIEARSAKSDRWFWHQVISAAISGMTRHLRQHYRAMLEGALVSTALLTLLGFQTIVAASVLNYVLDRYHLVWSTNMSENSGWLLHLATLSFVGALVIGCVTPRLHRRSRMAAVLAFGMSGTVAALLNLYAAFPKAPTQLFMPSATWQIAGATFFVFGLLAGFRTRAFFGAQHGRQ